MSSDSPPYVLYETLGKSAKHRLSSTNIAFCRYQLRLARILNEVGSGFGVVNEVVIFGLWRFWHDLKLMHKLFKDLILTLAPVPRIPPPCKPSKTVNTFHTNMAYFSRWMLWNIYSDYFGSYSSEAPSAIFIQIWLVPIYTCAKLWYNEIALNGMTLLLMIVNSNRNNEYEW